MTAPIDSLFGEVRGGEAFDLIDALNTGHAGSVFNHSHDLCSEGTFAR